MELQGLQCSLVDRDPGSELFPAVGHDFQLSCDGLQLSCGGVTNFYCEFLHISFIVSAGPSGLALIAVGTGTGVWFDKFIDRKTIKRDQTSSYHLWDALSSLLLACCCLLVIFFNFNFGLYPWGLAQGYVITCPAIINWPA